MEERGMSVPISFNEYQEFTRETDLYQRGDGVVLGLLAEAGEVAALFERCHRESCSGGPTCGQVADELGDVLYYVARLADRFGIRLDELASHNKQKLSARLERGQITKTARGG